MMRNTEIASLFDQLADLLEIQGENPFRVRAYRNAARVVGGMSKEAADLLAEGVDLTEIPAIGEALAQKIATIVKTGELPQLKQAEKRTPKAIAELMKLPALGAKRVRRLHTELEIRSFDDLKNAAATGRIRSLKLFGPKIEQLILETLLKAPHLSQRHKLPYALNVAESVVAFIKTLKGIKQVEIAGSIRRRMETIGDIDLVASAHKGAKIIEQFLKFNEIAEVLSHGVTRASVRLKNNVQVDIRVIPTVSYGAALLYFTGSKAHTIAIRKIAARKKIKINEYGVFKDEKRIAGKTEAEVYQKIGLSYIEPELREDRGEVALAKQNQLLKLITLDDMHGDLHSHTLASDGADSLENMANAAQGLGYDYLAITDHSKHLTIAHGLNEQELMEQIKKIDQLNNKLKNFTILKSCEIDILEDGTLDISNDVLKELDIRICSIHYKFNLPIEKQTERIIRAMDNPYFNILTHPTGRIIGSREAYQLDLERIFITAKDRNCFLEINAQPDRLDLNDLHCKTAKEIGVKFAISSDAHSVSQLSNMKFGIFQARRGWLTAEDVINTRQLAGLKKLLQRK